MKTSCDTVTLGEVLEAREARAYRQAAWLTRHGVPLVSITLVSPGPVKDGPCWRRVMRKAIDSVDTMLLREGWTVLECHSLWLRTGPEALYAVRSDPKRLKRALVTLEDRHALGRLWDLDVIAEGGPVSRRAFGIAPRRCLICGAGAHECARSRRHPLPALLAAVEQIANESE